VRRTTGIVHQNIQTAMLAHDRIDEGLRLIRITNVCGLKRNALWQTVRFSPATNSYRCTSARQSPGNLPTKTTRATGDNSHLAVKVDVICALHEACSP
jgi:hypothetical protein